MDFKKIELTDKELFDETLKNSEIYKSCHASELTFQNLFTWGFGDNIEYCLEGGIIYVTNYFEESQIYLPPLCKTQEQLKFALNKLAEEQGDFIMRGVPKNAAEIFTNDYLVIPDRNLYEYLYSPSELITLSGHKFHDKKNHLLQFTKGYNYIFRDYNAVDFNEVIKLSESAGSTAEEISAIKNALSNLNSLDLLSSVLISGGKIIGFSCGFITFENVGVVIFEKADRNYKGVYSALNNFFAAKYFSECIYINRQEDMGIEGLRKAKYSYNPVSLVEKYIISVKN